MTLSGCSVHVRAADAGLVVCLQPGLAQPQDTAEAAELCRVMMCYSGQNHGWFQSKLTLISDKCKNKFILSIPIILSMIRKQVEHMITEQALRNSCEVL